MKGGREGGREESDIGKERNGERERERGGGRKERGGETHTEIRREVERG